ncbi:hypothetical protein JRO89_XS04G0270400 [Xanthoceras sorbifolium]|uniref:Proline-rich protein PRCC n=1 Tax=Xanthoceras sorbifolium TaxID=99658 RepID=A0ABQ8I7D3_9ROSI|nr:hypothetical protein JRO89_XS04G0270400 [Xanthoceras sorbifolium]
MESLVANYASSDEEDEQPKVRDFPTTKASALSSSLPQPKSSSLFSSIPQPKHLKNPKTETPLVNNIIDHDHQDSKKPTSSNSNKPSPIFSSLPQPKSETPQHSTTKRVVKFMPAIIKPNSIADEDEDEDDEEKEQKKRKESQYVDQSSSVKSFLSSIPAPKSSATLGALPSGSGSGRRSIIETESPALSSSGLRANNESSTDQNGVNYASFDSGSGQNIGNYANYEAGIDQSVENYANYEVGGDQNVESYVNYDSYHSGNDQNMQSSDASIYVNYGVYGGYGDYDQYGSATMVQETAGVVAVPRKRGRNEIPADIVEVKQDELMKDRPREDQVKLTGIAFGPSYQPVSTKGKPSKLHKRKHQIGSLYYDMKQKETELAERRAKGFQTKAQTQSKYGW